MQLVAFPSSPPVLRQWLLLGTIALQPCGYDRETKPCIAKLHIPRHFNFVVSLRVLPTYIKLYKMPQFLFCGAGDRCACGEGTAMAVNYYCLKSQLDIRKIRLWLCSVVRPDRCPLQSQHFCQQSDIFRVAERSGIVIIIIMGLGHLLTRSGLTYPEVSSKVCHDSFCQLGSSISLPWLIYFEAFYLHVVSSFSYIPVICPKSVLFLTPLQFVHLFCNLSKCILGQSVI